MRRRLGLALRRVGLGLLALGALLLAIAAPRSGLRAPEPTFLLRDRNGEFLCEIADGGRDAELGFWPLAELPPRVIAATLALEDQRFAWHPGVDPLAIARAFVGNWRAGRRTSGASTLAMQLARMQDPGPRSYPRKLLEAATAVLLTLRHGREAVLGHYLRLAPYGNRIRGIGYAARRYLDKPVADLSWAEIAFLAAIPQSPSRMNPYAVLGRDRAVQRGRRILAALHARGVLDAAELTLALEQIRFLRIPQRKTRPDEALHAVLRLEAQLADPAARARLRQAPLLESTLDLGVQRIATRAARATLLAEESRGAGNAALVVLERGSNAVRAWVGSAGFGEAGRAGAIDYTMLPRSPGSTVKPLLYALALERGAITPATVLDDLGRGPGGITNADERYLGPMLPRTALANSRNVPAAAVLRAVGLHAGHDFLREAGLHDGEQPAERYGLGLAIGGLPTTLERLARAYTALAGDGRVGELVWIPGQPAASRRILSPAVVAQVQSYLSDPLARLPSFPRMGHLEYPFPVAVKTGTSSDFKDGWTVAWSARYLLVGWIGHPDGRSMEQRTGYQTAARMVHEVLRKLHAAESQGLAEFTPPPAGLLEARICALSGKLATLSCERGFREWFRPGRQPEERCDVHLRVEVDRRHGGLATARTPSSAREARTVVALPPRYQKWAREQRLAAAPATPAAARARPRVLSPEPGARIAIDPEAPPGHSTLALAVDAPREAEQVVWWVDGQPWQVAPAREPARWPLVRGEHVFEARLLTGETSARVRVSVN